MKSHLSQAALVVLTCVLLSPSTLGQEHRTYALFNLDSRTESPFPSDWLTVPDDTQNTGRRVSLPKPAPADCQVHVSDCEDIDVINELDGFNIQPRLSVPFSGPIDEKTVTSDTVFLVSLGSTLPAHDEMPWGTVVGINQIVWDTFTNTLHVESDALLAQHTRFALIVTRGIQDANGFPVKASPEFRAFRVRQGDAYTSALTDAMRAGHHVGVSEGDIVVASVFTTQSATAVLERIRAQIYAATPEPANFLLGPNDTRTVFARNQITTITWRQQTLADPPYFPPPSPTNPSQLPLANLNIFPGSVGSIAFGKFRSPDYELHPGEYIPAVGTRNGEPVVKETNEIYVNLFLPSGPTPSNGWPVVIVGHAVNNSKNVAPFNVASSMAKYGLATIAINAVGHGFGPQSTLTINRTVGPPVVILEGGRGIDQNNDGTIEDSEGLGTNRPRSVAQLSDGFRQTAVDLMQLVRVIEVGMDVDGDGLRDVDPSRICYLGNSLGGGYGIVFLGVAPNVRAGVISVPFDPIPGTFLGIRRAAAASVAGARQPSLLNFPGITAIDGVGMTGPLFFDENRPLRDQMRYRVDLEDHTTRDIRSPVINDVVGAMEIQAMAENLEWVSQAGSPLAYAPHLRKAPLASLAAKSILLQIAKGDQSATNPSTTAIIRAGDLADSTLYYLHDLFWAQHQTLTTNPHGFAVSVGNAIFRPISLAVQDQSGQFLSSDGVTVSIPQPSEFFEFPIVLAPEGLNYIVP